MALLVALGMLIALLTDGWNRRWDGPPAEHSAQEQDRGPGGLLFIVGGVLLVGGVATALAYRRISRPVGDLLGASEKVAEGRYDVDVTPAGPRELRLLVTTFNDMAKRLAENDEQRRRFLADITHELRTPLAVLQSEVEAQLDGVHPRDDQHLASLLEEIERLGRLVEDLHTLALAEAGRIVLHPELVSPVALVEDAIEAHTALAQQKDVEIHLSLPAPAPGTPAAPAASPDSPASAGLDIPRSGAPEGPASGLPDIEVDPTRVRQVLDNLLSNAVRHSPPGSEVVVTIEADAASSPSGSPLSAPTRKPPAKGDLVVEPSTNVKPGSEHPAGIQPDIDPSTEVKSDVKRSAQAQPGVEGSVHAQPGAERSAKTGPPQVRFTVTDAGPGFPPDQLDQVFERFVRSADSRGSGLGLSIARDLVQAHGGTIQARNNRDGGASVTFTLPHPT